MRNARGNNCTPGEFRHSQNWIGAAGSTLSTASFVPPPVPEMKEAMGNLEKYIHEGEGWIKFFLKGIILVANQAVKMSRKIVDLQTSHYQLVAERVVSPNAYKFLEYLYQRPIISTNDVVSALEISFPTANRLINQFCDNGLLLEKTGKARNRIFAYMPYLDVLNEESLSSDNDI